MWILRMGGSIVISITGCRIGKWSKVSSLQNCAIIVEIPRAPRSALLAQPIIRPTESFWWTGSIVWAVDIVFRLALMDVVISRMILALPINVVFAIIAFIGDYHPPVFRHAREGQGSTGTLRIRTTLFQQCCIHDDTLFSSLKWQQIQNAIISALIWR